MTVHPAPGESLRSLVEQAAGAHGVPVTPVLAAGGIKTVSTLGRTLSLLENEAEPHTAGIATLLGLTRATVRSMTLRGSQDPTLVDWKNGRAVHRGWGIGVSGRHCVRCLAENGGRWLLTWLSPWTQVCTRHEMFLASRCPACAQPPRSGTHVSGDTIPNGTRCAACSADLTTGTAHPAPTASYAHLGQAYVDELRRQPATDAVTNPAGGQTLVSDQFQDLRLLARHLHALARPGDYDLTGTEAADWQGWTAHRDRPTTFTHGTSDKIYGAANRKAHIEVATYAAAVGVASTVLIATDMTQANRRLAPVLYSAYRDRGRLVSAQRHSVRSAWSTEDAAQWLFDAVEWAA